MHKNDDFNKLFTLANKYWEENKLDQAFLIFKELAENDFIPSFLNLGYFYDEGLRGKKNKKEAIYWYEKAAIKNDSSAMENLGLVYKELNEFDKAAYWLKKALKNNNGDAAYELGKMFIHLNNFDLAKAYLTVAIKHEYITDESRENAKIMLSSL